MIPTNQANVPSHILDKCVDGLLADAAKLPDDVDTLALVAVNRGMNMPGVKSASCIRELWCHAGKMQPIRWRVSLHPVGGDCAVQSGAEDPFVLIAKCYDKLKETIRKNTIAERVRKQVEEEMAREDAVDAEKGPEYIGDGKIGDDASPSMCAEPFDGVPADTRGGAD